MAKDRREIAPVSGGHSLDPDTDTFSFGTAAACERDADKLPPFGSSNSNSPADLWFSNGLILPHSFPSRSMNRSTVDSYQIPSCITNSGSSNSSSRSSGRRNSQQSAGYRPTNTDPANVRRSNSTPNNLHRRSAKRHSDSAQANVQSVLAAAYRGRPPASPQPKKIHIQGAGEARIKSQSSRKLEAENSWLGRSFFRSFVTACRECHALEPSSQVERVHGKIGVHA